MSILFAAELPQILGDLHAISATEVQIIGVIGVAVQLSVEASKVHAMAAQKLVEVQPELPDVLKERAFDAGWRQGLD